MFWTISGYGWGFEGQDNNWSTTAKVCYAEELGCPANFGEFPSCRNSTLYEQLGIEDTCFSVVQIENSGTRSIYSGGFGVDTITFIQFDNDCATHCLQVYDKCFHAFLVWVNPLLLSLGLGLLSFVFIFASKRKNVVATNTINRDPTDLVIGGSVIADQEVSLSLKLTAKMYFVLVFLIGSCASLAGAGEGLTVAFLVFTLSSMVSLLIVILFVINEESDERSDDLVCALSDDAVAMDERLESYQPYTDILRGLILLTLFPVTLVYVTLSFMNECIRRSGLFPFTQQHNEDENSLLTRRVQKQIEHFCSWKDTCRVYRYALYWGMGFMFMNVIVQQLLVVFLLW